MSRRGRSEADGASALEALSRELLRGVDALDRWVDRASELMERRWGATCALCALLALAVRVWFTDFDQWMIKDPYEYLVRAIQLAEGDLAQRREQHLGWSLFLSVFVDPDAAIAQSMRISREVSVILGALSAVPLGMIARRVAGARTAAATLVIFALFPPLVKSAGFAHTDPLFGFLFLSFAYAVFLSERRPWFLAVAGFLGGLSFWVRPNGLFLLPMLGLGWWVWRREWHPEDRGSLKFLAMGLFSFAAVAAPYLAWRHLALGSMFDYGENAKYLIDRPGQIWNPNVAAPGLSHYLDTRSLSRVLHKFVVGGIWYVLRDYLFFATWPFLSALLAVGVAMGLAERRRRLILGLVLVWNIGLIPVYEVYFSQRHILPTLTLLLVLAADALLRLVDRAPARRVALVAIFFVPFALGSGGEMIRMKNDASRDAVQSGLEWARWSIEHLEGRIAIGEGRDLVDIALRSEPKRQRRAAKLEVVRLPPFDTATDAIEWLTEHRVRYLVVDATPYMRKGRGYLGNLLGELPGGAREVYTNRSRDAEWPVRIIEVSTATTAR